MHYQTNIALKEEDVMDEDKLLELFKKRVGVRLTKVSIYRYGLKELLKKELDR